jgi:hypothetical protein
MSQIKTTVLYRRKESPHVISTVFFLKPESYKNRDYKAYFVRFLSLADKFRDFEVRIYVDDTSKEYALQEAEKVSNATIIHFDCPPFRDGPGHYGTFGTIVRFLPLFEPGLETVWISDIDVGGHIFTPSVLNDVEDVFLDTQTCYSDRPNSAGRHFAIIGHRFISRVTFSKQLLTNFLKKLEDGSFKHVVNEMLDFYNPRGRPADSIFPYGMDEYFLNTKIFDAIRRHNLKCTIYRIYGIYFIRNQIHLTPQELKIQHTFHSSNTQKSFDAYKQVLAKKAEEYPDNHCLQEIAERLPFLTKNSHEIFVVKGKDLY